MTNIKVGDKVIYENNIYSVVEINIETIDIERDGVVTLVYPWKVEKISQKDLLEHVTALEKRIEALEGDKGIRLEDMEEDVN